MECVQRVLQKQINKIVIMLSPRLTHCPECADIPSLLKKIDCKLAELGNNLYNNISYMLNKRVPADDITQLIGYRRILMYKFINPSYLEKYSIAMIASRVIRLTVGCVSRCNTPEPCLEESCDVDVVLNPTTTTTSTLTTCKSYLLYNTANSAESFLIGNCNTGQPETITLQGLSSVCISTIVALNVSSNIVVIEKDSCPTTTTTTTITPLTTTTSTSSGGSTTTTTTLFPPSRNTTPVFNDAGVICLAGYDTLQCGFNPECTNYYYDLITCPNLTVGCTLYTDVFLTNIFTAIPTDFYAEGISAQFSYQISASGQIVNILNCPSPPPLAQYCSSCVAVNIDGTPFNVGGGVTATSTYTGDVRTYPNPHPVQFTLDVLPPNCAWLGRNRDPFTLTLNFSQPISSINVYQVAGDFKENYKYDTNTGVPTLTDYVSSYTTIQDNLTYSINGWGLPGQGNSLLIISNTTPFTSLTISGWTGPFPGRPVPSGSVFAICTQLV
jgi:hypothetical protein